MREFDKKMQQAFRQLALKPGDIYESCNYHPVMCMSVDYTQDEIWGISLIDGKWPMSCSLVHCGIRKLSPQQAWEIKMSGPADPEARRNIIRQKRQWWNARTAQNDLHSSLITPGKKQASLTLLPWSAARAVHFKRLNLEWIEAYFKVEPSDRKVLDNPQREIIDKGGHIYFAKMGKDIVGTFALMPKGRGEFELAKMAVSQTLRGAGIGKTMMQHAIEEAKKLGAAKLSLESNTVLDAAMKLYKSVGFKKVSLGDASQYERCNIKMVLEL